MSLKLRQYSRRRVLQTSVGMAAMSLCPGIVPRAAGFESANARPRIGVIGSIILIVWSLQAQVVAADVIVIPLSCSCSIQSITAAPS